MAESQAVAKHALKKLENQLTCAICLEAFKDPKLLQCFHVYCKDCLQRLVVQDQQGQLSLRCPTCQQSTLLPPTATDVSVLQSAFHIHHFLEIQDALEKLKEPKKVKCQKCNKDRSATSYCRDCGKFICATCAGIHSDWDEYAKHEVVALEQLGSKVKQLDTLKKVTLYCSFHHGKKLKLYCETCGELICLHCTVSKHCRPEHKYDLVSDTFERHKAEIMASLKPVEEHLGVVSKSREQLELRSHDLHDQQAAIKDDIHQQIQQLIDMLLARKAELFGQLDQLFQTKMKNLTAQKDKLETVHTQLTSCVSFVTDSLRTGSEGEVMKMKKTMMKQIKEMIHNFKPDKLFPCEPANLKFISFPPAQASQLQQFGEVYLQTVATEKCYATGKGLETAMAGERATALVHVLDNKEKTYSTLVETVTCELVSEITDEKIDCSVKKTEGSQYEISYQPTSHGRHQLHIKIKGGHIKESPFSVIVKLPVQKLSNPIKTITELNRPWGVVANQRGEVVVAETSKYCVSVYSLTGEKVLSFGSKGSRNGQFNDPRGVVVDGDGNILVVDGDSHCVQKFTSDGKFITAVGKRGNNPLEFNYPRGITIHPLNKKVHIVDKNNHRVQILNPNLTFSSTFGSYGSGNGQLSFPWDVAFDSTGNVYVADGSNHRIQVFTAEGEYLRQFGKKGRGNGELNFPSSITIDSDNVVYVTEDGNHRVSVFTCKGKFLTSFGTKGSGPGQFHGPHGIAVDKNGIVYVSDTDNNRLQVF